MLLRRSGPLALALAAAACAPSVPQVAGPSEVDVAVFDPSNSLLPQPNDLILAQDVNGLPVSAAQRDLLLEFQKAGGFPNDQEVAITIDFRAIQVNAQGQNILGYPDLDLTSFNAGNFAVFAINTSTGSVSAAKLEPITAADYSNQNDHGTLTLHNKGKVRWTPGAQYVVAIRGGPSGPKLKNGNPIGPMPTTFLLTQDQKLNDPANQALLITQLGSRAAAAAAGEQLEAIRKGYLGAFTIIDSVFPHRELALIQTFKIAPLAGAHVEVDPSSGQVPLPSNFLLDPANGGKTVVKNPAFGPLAAGIATLDGFSTTAMLIMPTSGNVDTFTVRNAASGALQQTVALYELTATGAVQVDASTYESEPSAISGTPAGVTGCVPTAAGQCFSPIIGLQPGAPALSHGSGAFATRPLKENTTYGVVVTSRVKDSSGNPLSRPTVAKILLFSDPLVTVNGTTVSSNLAGIDAGTAGGLEVMRQQLVPVIAKASADLGITKDDVAMAYTFRTQTITGVAALTDPTKQSGALQLAAAPYQKDSTGADKFPAVPVCGAPAAALGLPACTTETVAQAFTRFGVDTNVVNPTNLAAVLEVNIATLNLLDPATGAFRPDPSVCATVAGNCIEFVRATITVPIPTKVTTACPAPTGLTGSNCAPLVVYRHGIGDGRGDLLTMADALAAKGMVGVAIDAAKHNDRSWCSVDAECAPGKTCVADPALANQGDTVKPGHCGGAPGGFQYQPVLCKAGSVAASCTGYDSTKGGSAVGSGDFLISGNLFRSRDTLRQDIIDQSMLVRVIAPFAPPTAGTHYVFETLKGIGVATNGTPIAIFPGGPTGGIYWLSQSLGSISGTVDTAVNPRFSKVALNVGGGTLIDTFTNGSYKAKLAPLLASLGITPGTAAYLQFINVAKWIIDPADPINFAKNLKTAPLPNLLIGGTSAMPAKSVLGQRAQCDSTVPDAFNLELYSNIGLPYFSNVNPGTPNVAGSAVTVFTTTNAATVPQACPAGGITHGFITNWVTPTLTMEAQADAAAFLATDTVPAPIEVP